MLAALTAALVLTCAPHRPPPPAPPSVVRCEGADFVRRSGRGVELERWVRAPRCSIARCEGADWVRRDSRGVEMERWVNAPAPYCPAPAVGGDEGRWRFGLTARR